MGKAEYDLRGKELVDMYYKTTPPSFLGLIQCTCHIHNLLAESTRVLPST